MADGVTVTSLVDSCDAAPRRTENDRRSSFSTARSPWNASTLPLSTEPHAFLSRPISPR